MNYRMKRIASCLLAGAIVISGTGVGTYGAQTGGVSAVIATGLSSNGSPAAGFSKMLSQCLIESDKAVAEAAAQAEEQVSENDVPVVASEYADIAIAQVDNYVNVRSEPNTDSEVLGKLYNNSAATVLETTEDGWYKITSGSVTGYVKCEYVVTGDEELAKKVSTRYATVTTTTLYVRMEPSTEAGILTMLGEGDDFVVVDDSMKDSGWVIVTTEEGDGYVSTDYVNLWKADHKAFSYSHKVCCSYQYKVLPKPHLPAGLSLSSLYKEETDLFRVPSQGMHRFFQPVPHAKQQALQE